MLACSINQYGNIYIDKDVVAKIANIAAKECYGLVGMASRNKNGIVELLSFANGSKGISVNITENIVNLKLFVIVQYGTNIAVVAENIIERVKYYVEHQTGLKVGEITLNVDGVRVQK